MASFFCFLVGVGILLMRKGVYRPHVENFTNQIVVHSSLLPLFFTAADVGLLLAV